MKYSIKFLLAALLPLAFAGAASAQNEQSPYSRYGYGMIGDYATSAQRNMGGVGIAMSDGRQINVMNPASYAAADSLTLIWDIGVDLTQLWSEEDGNTGKSFGGGLDYMTLQFPISKHIGGSIGLVPYTTVGYSFGNDLTASDDGYTTSSSGYGGINELYAGVGVQPFKGLSIGANVAYQFGTIVNDNYVASSSLFEQVIQVRDWNLLLGAQYTIQARKHRVTLGATYSPAKDFHGKTWGVYYDVNNDTAADTVGYSHLNGKYSKPHAFGAGVNYTFNRQLMVEADFTYQKWADADFYGIRDSDGNVLGGRTTLDNRWRAALGFQFTPRERGSYFRRVAYRVGGSYTRDYIVVNGNHIREYSVGLGFGLPTNGTKTVINLGIEYKRRQAYPQHLVTENYLNITLGVNFMELAFWKDKIR